MAIPLIAAGAFRLAGQVAAAAARHPETTKKVASHCANWAARGAVPTVKGGINGLRNALPKVGPTVRRFAKDFAAEAVTDAIGPTPDFPARKTSAGGIAYQFGKAGISAYLAARNSDPNRTRQS
jgi:hypothetical protein